MASGSADNSQNDFCVLRARLLSTCAAAGTRGFAPDLIESALVREGLDKALAPVIFPRGLPELVQALARRGDGQLLAMHGGAGAKEAEPALPLRHRVENALMARLEIEKENPELLRRMTGFLLLPPNLPAGFAVLARSSDAIWRAAGDRPRGFDYYSKRALLMPVFAASLLVWIRDEDEARQRTRRFARRAIAAAEAQGRQAGRWFSGGFSAAPDFFRFFRRAASALGRQRYSGSAPKG